MLTGRRGLALTALGILTCAGGLLAWFRERKEAPKVKLVFIGYTNYALKIYNPKAEGSIWIQKAIIGISNGSATPILPIPYTQGVKLGATGNYLYAPSTPISPGEMVLTTSFLSSSNTEFEANLAYTRMGRIAKLNKDLKNSQIALIARLLPSPQLEWAQVVWHTNPPPKKRFHINSPPPPFKFDPPSQERNTMEQ